MMFRDSTQQLGVMIGGLVVFVGGAYLALWGLQWAAIRYARARARSAEGPTDSSSTEIENRRRTIASQSLALAESHAIEARHEEALSCYDTAIEAGINSADAFSGRAMCLQALGFDLDAIDDLDRAIEIDPTDSNLYFMRGNSKNAVGDLVGCVADVKQAVQVSEIDSEIQRSYDAGAKEQGHRSARELYASRLALHESIANAESRSEQRRRDNPNIDLGPAISDQRRAMAKRRPQASR